MAHTDPIADMLTRVRNGIMAEKKDVAIPLSTIKLDIAKILKEEGYISNFRVDKTKMPAQLFVELKYSSKKQNVIEGLKRISKPGRRVYTEADSIPKVLEGLGVAVISTSQGIVTGKECKKRNIGGEVLLYVW
ncbi:MAG: 30S ribosomal protein S8 [Candidatus Aminicenantes bacterium]|jgi:small subunit ribosomal protein S8|nr:30S ribosomal protein S8 [Candidatus Aminicenantes bacterium]MCJ7524059.1 30S ribosomal protein S8 [Candidatus Aminicenantes bacterium]TFG80385.1 MAG: 30S ribosomal protein S8 [Chrysiogenales bacterium]